MENKTQEAKVYPPSASHSGDNAYYIKGCDIVQHSPSYAACLWKITENEVGRTYPGKEHCVDAINAKRCRAVEMRQEELLKGVAIYFFPRQFIQNKVITNLTPLSEIPVVSPKWGRTVSVERTPPKTKQTALDKEFDGDENGFAAAINAEMQNLTNAEIQKPAPVVSAPTVVKPALPEPPKGRLAMLAGETPLQYARRVAAFRQSQQSQPQGQPA